MIEDISFGYDYDESGLTLIAKELIQDYGLFSTFCLLLSATTACQHKCGSVPDKIIFGNSLRKFNTPENPIDLYDLLFGIDHNVKISSENDFHVGPDNHHTLYNHQTITGLQPFFKRYFSLNKDMLNLKSNIESNYNIEDSNRLSVIYRGSDKWTDFGGFISVGPAAYYRLAHEIFHQHQDSGIKVLIQTEDSGIADWFCRSLNGTFINETQIGHTESTLQPLPLKDKHNWLRHYVASLYIHAQSKFLITYTGNSGYFTALSRGNDINLFQDYTFTKNCRDFFTSNESQT